ncbi:MAG: HAMP domain-containing histidine kinase [Deltaproteobacteria bacterium]|nr:MAG: HAMP domain-containing histidine kinase [Deltaproteobacteria bacterium]
MFSFVCRSWAPALADYVDQVIGGGRLVLRIYAIGLGQVAALAAALAIAREANRRPAPPHAEQTRFLVEEIAAHAQDGAALEARLRELKQRTGMEVLLEDRSGNRVAGSASIRRRGPGTLPDGGPLFAVAAAAVLVGISAVLTAAWLARPLRVLSAAARNLGAGKLSTRTNLRRSDELGDVAVAFDEMAGRIESLVRGQRELLANVSHELRTPLARIRVALDLAAEGSAEEAAAQLSGIAGDLAELERLTSDILASARLELSSAQPPVRVERTSAREMVEDAAARFRAHHPAHPLRVENRCGDAQVDVDRMMLRRALDNLLSNAGKHGGPGEVALLADAGDGRLTIEVRDRGAGIAPEDMEQLFTPFFRADRSRARQTGGLGLGLLLARRIVEAHRGTLEIESNPGEGTVARIRVPLAS